MNPIDRFTRDDVSAKVWWPLAMLLVVLFVLTFPSRGDERDRARQAAAARGALIVTEVVDPALGDADLGDTLAPALASDLSATITDEVLDEDGTVAVVRVWARDGRLLYSGSDADVPGSEAAINDDRIKAAADDPQRAFTLRTETTPTGEPADPRYVVYLALPSTPGVVAEVEFDDDAVLAATNTKWFTYQAALLLAGALVLTLAGLSMREPVARIGAGVAFYPTSVPAGSAVIDADDAALLRQAGAHARRRVQGMQDRMESLELEKVQLEGELQRALSTRAMATPVVATAIPRAAAPAVAPDVEPVPVAPRPARKPVVAPEPAVVKAVEPEPVKAVEPEPVVASVPAPQSEDDSMGFVLLPETEVIVNTEPPPSPDRWAASATPPREVALPEDQPDEDVLSILERLVEPVGASAKGGVDPGDLRARLARTAARKKPGSRAAEQFNEGRDPH